jgi:hypothetical protein
MKNFHIAAFAGTFLISIGAWQLKEVLDLRTQVARIEQKLDDHIAADKAMASNPPSALEIFPPPAQAHASANVAGGS